MNRWSKCLILTTLAGAGCGKVQPVTDAGGGGSADSTVQVDAGNVGPAALAVLPLAHQYGPVAVSGSSPPKMFTFSNTGAEPATGCSAPQKAGAHATDFDITSDACGTTDLAGGASCAVQVSAKPTMAGARTMTLTRTCTVGGTASTTANAIVVNEPMYAFVTAAETNGNLGGLSGADTKCQTAGAAGTVSGPKNKTWKALLSQTTTTVVNAKDRFVWSGPVYGMNGAILVPNPSSWPWSALTSNLSAINLTQNGDAGGSYAWTGTQLDGTASAADCNGWTADTNAFMGRVGETTFISSSSWVDSYSNGCSDTFFALYCISQ